MAGVLIAIAVGIVAILLINAAGNSKPPRSSGGWGGAGGIAIGQPRAYASPLSHLLSFGAVNGLGLASVVVSALAVDSAWPWWTSIPLAFGWIAFWGFAVNPMVYPAAYLARIKAQDKNTEPAFICHGIAALVWLLIHLVTLLPMLSVN